ncbi:hypothetical protein [Actinomadura luteofluorescens]|uniref:hypothetical protein n=1 Tax=Actinomadura luteofluorescens TaxID=46163 RepID=UPI003D8DA728
MNRETAELKLVLQIIAGLGGFALIGGIIGTLLGVIIGLIVGASVPLSLGIFIGAVVVGLGAFGGGKFYIWFAFRRPRSRSNQAV